MAYIRLIDDQEAEGVLATLYQQAKTRAGRVYNILRCMSLAPRHLRASVALYSEVMHGESPLTRAQREILAVGVSSANHCHY